MFSSGLSLGDISYNNIKKEAEMSYDIDDIVVCKLHDGSIVATYDMSNDKISVKIIGWKDFEFSSKEYIAYVPEYEFARLKSDVVNIITRTIAKDYGIHPRFVDEHMIRIRASHIVKAEYEANGKKCSNCQEYYDMAASNMPDGTFYCSACKLNPWR